MPKQKGLLLSGLCPVCAVRIPSLRLRQRHEDHGSRVVVMCGVVMRSACLRASRCRRRMALVVRREEDRELGWRHAARPPPEREHEVDPGLEIKADQRARRP